VLLDQSWWGVDLWGSLVLIGGAGTVVKRLWSGSAHTFFRVWPDVCHGRGEELGGRYAEIGGEGGSMTK